MAWAIFDTSVYVAHWQDGLPDAQLVDLRQAFIVRHSAVVLSELRRGARTPAARQLVNGLFRLARVQWAPSPSDWCAPSATRKDGEITKRREFQNDALIALTARRHGATVVTTNRQDFALLEEAIGISVLNLLS